MKLRTALIVGLAAGYVLGARAGRERYEQIRKVARVVADNPPVRQLIDETSALITAGTTKAREAISEGLHGVGESIRDATD
jgi:hypothetical protein